MHSLTQLISVPTRTTYQTSLIDHILTNSPEKVTMNGIIELGLSDHDLIYCTRKTSNIKVNKHNEIFIRSMKKYSVDIFEQKLNAADFPDTSNYTCVNAAYNDFISIFLSVIDSIAPLKSVRVKSNTKPWFDTEIFDAIQVRDKAYKRYKRFGKETDKDSFKNARFLLKKLISNKKKQFIEEKITENKNNPKELWKTLKSLGLPSKRGGASRISLKENGVIVFDSKENANIFKTLFFLN